MEKVNEYGSYGKSFSLHDPDLYKFATTTLVDICAKYVEYAFWCKAKCIPNKGKAGNDLHRASFRATITSLQSDKSSRKENILCKIYNVNRDDDMIAVDFEAIFQGYYTSVASVIDGTVYYLPMSWIEYYQAEMGNSCVSPNRKFINVAADFFIENASGSYKLSEEDLERYNKDYRKYVLKEPVVKKRELAMTENKQFSFNKAINEALNR